MKKNVFIASLFIYMLAFNLLVLNAVSKYGTINNFVTGNVIGLNEQAVTDYRFVLPLFMFNLAIIGLFVLSYHNYNLLKKHSGKHYHKA